MRASSVHRPASRSRLGPASPLSLVTCVACVAWLGLPVGAAFASDSLRPAAAPPVAPMPVAASPAFDSFPAHLLPSHAVRRPPTASAESFARAVDIEGELAPTPVVFMLTSMLEWPGFSPLEMEQPVRVYENDVLVKFRAPGGRSSFATVELIF